MNQHISKICQYKGESVGMKEARHHICMYLKGFSGASKFRDEACHLKTLKEYEELVQKILKSY